jgi:hypothetical protein
MKTPQIPAEPWIKNLLEAAQVISDREYQEKRWLAEDALAWETPEEAIMMLDDSVLDGFCARDERVAGKSYPKYFERICARTLSRASRRTSAGASRMV